MNVLIGITGSISAYKVLTLIRMFKKNNHNVKVILTPAAKQFIPTLAIASFGVEFYEDQFDNNVKQPIHINLSKWADVFLIAPASLNTISKMAMGICDNLLLSTYFVFQKRVIIAPAMNGNMYKQRVLKSHLNFLKEQNIVEIPPCRGYLASYDRDVGHLEEIDIIYEEVLNHLDYDNSFKGKNILISAGGSMEQIDPVRVISNLSTGTMGRELALAFYRKGANVKVITSREFKLPHNIEKIMVKTVADYYKAVKSKQKWYDIYVSAAALSDFIPIYSKGKIKKEHFNGTIQFKKAVDVLKEVLKDKKKAQIVIGFAAETEIDEKKLNKKFKTKPVDMLVVNKISNTTGFGNNKVEGFIYFKGEKIQLNGISKAEVSKKIIGLLKNE